MLVHILLSILFGVIAYWLAGLLRASHQVAVIVGIVVGILVYVGALGL